MYGNRGVFDGLTQVAEIDLSEPDYSFDLLGIWKDANGGYYLGTDSGCSCPSPWENHTRDDLTGPLTADQAREEARSLKQFSYQKEYDIEGFNATLDNL